MKSNNSFIASITYALCFVPWVLGNRDEFVAYHQKQAIVLAIAGFVGQGAIGVLGWWFNFLQLWSLWSLLFMPLIWALRIFLAYEVVMGVRHVLANEQKPLPWIGRFVHGV